MTQNRILVTGGAGFIGSHICEELLNLGHRVRVIDNLSSGHLSNIAHLGSAVEFIEGDIRNPDAVEKACAGMTHVFHEAALVSVFESVEKPVDNHEINLTGTLNVMNAARKHKVKRVVMASSAAIYGNDPELPKKETMRPQPESPYAIGKIAGEYYLRVFAGLYGVQTVSLRYFNVFGPRQDPRSFYSGVISKFTDDIMNKRNPTIFGDGMQSRDFVFVKDIVQGNMKAMFSDNVGNGEAFNIATNRACTLLDLASTLSELIGRKVDPVFKDARAGDIRHSLADISLAAKVLGYSPQYDLKTGLAQLLQWNAGK